MSRNATSLIRLYHERLAPQGWEFEQREALSLARAGWVDTPAKFDADFPAHDTTSGRTLGYWSRHEVLATVALIAATVIALAAGFSH